MNFLARASIAVLGLCAASPAMAHVFHDCDGFVKFGAPGEKGDLLCRVGYAVAHDPERKVPYWVGERLTREMVFKAVPRTDSFRADPELTSGKRSELTDYRDSGFEPGPMAAAWNMRWNEKAFRESHYLSNAAPQVGPGLRDGVWKELEEKVRAWATQRYEIYVFTGPVYASGIAPRTIGQSKVAVPDAFFKVVYDPARVEVIAFIVPNTAIEENALASYLVSVNVVERKTGLDFLSGVQADVQKVIESKKARELWH